MKSINIKMYTCKRHFILSPGVIIAVVKTPESIPALKSWINLQTRKEKETIY